MEILTQEKQTVDNSVEVFNQAHKNGLSTNSKNKKWLAVTTLDNIAAVICLGILLTVDLYILSTTPSLYPFFIAMIIVLGIFALFYFGERFLAKQFDATESKLDAWFVFLAVIRNIVFVLNFIPFVQIVGGILLVFGFVPYVIIYCILLYSRKKVA